MRTTALLTAALLSATALRAQTISTFENLSLPTADTYYVNNTIGQEIGFASGAAYFPRTNDTSFGYTYWSFGFGYSNGNDTTDGSYANDHSAIPGEGHAGSAQYGYGYGRLYHILNQDTLLRLSGVWLTNTTLVYRSLLNGDQFAKKFGGPTGNDPDYYRAIFTAYRGGVQSGNPMSFYFADFRDANNANDYIVNDWRLLQFPNLAWDSLAVALESSDVGSFGINTPLYWALDDLTLTPAGLGVHTATLAQNVLRISPVPAHGEVSLSAASPISDLTILDARGALVYRALANGNKTAVNVAGWPGGVYLIRAIVGGVPVTQRLIVE